VPASPEHKKNGVFFGWWTVLTGAFLTLWGYGYNVYGISALFKPISAELGFSRAATSVAASIIKIEGAFESPLSGWIADKYGPRWICIWGIVVMSTGLILMNWMHSLWAFYLDWGIILGTGFNMAVGLPMSTAISNWFVKKRGIALGLQSMFSSAAVMLIVPLISWMIDTSGWRMACVYGGVVMAVVGLPLAWFFIKDRRPEFYGLFPDGARIETNGNVDQMITRGAKYAAEVQEVEFTLRESMRTPTYWMLIFVYGTINFGSIALNVHAIPLLTDLGISPVGAASIMGIMGMAGLPARLITGFLADRISRGNLRFLLMSACVLSFSGLALFLYRPTTLVIYIWFVLWGMGVGDAFALNAIMRARYFGRKAIGSIGGSATLFLTPFAVVSPIYLGWMYDTSGSYTRGLQWIAGLLAVGIIAALFVPAPKPPSQTGDIRKLV